MKKLILIVITSCSISVLAQAYKAEIFNLKPESKQLDFTLEINEIQNLETVQIKGVFKKKDEIQQLYVIYHEQNTY